MVIEQGLLLHLVVMRMVGDYLVESAAETEIDVLVVLEQGADLALGGSAGEQQGFIALNRVDS